MSQATVESGVEPPSSGTQAKPTADELSLQVSAIRDEMRQLHRLTVLGTAAATIAHEFNNLMTPVVGYAKPALDSGDVELMKKALALTLKQTAIMTAMSDRILGLAANEAQTAQTVKVREVVEEAIACLCRDLAKDGITLNVEVDVDLSVRANPMQLQQVLLNLLINAREAIGDRSGCITVEASRTGDESVSVSVRDNGCGVPADMVDRIFDPFVSTKNGRGTGVRSGVGLGLAVCRDIVQENQGTISVESKLGAGTTLTLTLPAAD